MATKAHVYYECKDPECLGCCYCEGGLAFCIDCKGGEASLPTDCPNRPMTDAEEEGIMAGKLDFQDEKWLNL